MNKQVLRILEITPRVSLLTDYEYLSKNMHQQQFIPICKYLHQLLHVQRIIFLHFGCMF